MKSKIYGILGLALALAMSVTLAPAAGLWNRGDQTFFGTLTIEHDLNVTGNTAFTGVPTFETAIVADHYYLNTTTTLNATSATGTYIMVDNTAGNATIGLPEITTANLGLSYVIKKMDSNATAGACAAVYSYSGQYIESTRGTYTGTSDVTNDAAGDVKAWIAGYNSTDYIWFQLYVNQS